MASLIGKTKQKNSELKRAGDAHRDPADLGGNSRPAVSPSDLSVPGARLLSLPLSRLTYNPRNPRDEDLKSDPETVELAASMALLGQQQSAVVVSREAFLDRWPEYGEKVPTPWVIMIGNRRRAAAEINQWPALECIVRDKITTDLDDLPIHENLHRKGINPLKMAYYLADQVKILGGERPVAKKVGKSQPWVNQLLKLLKLTPELQALVKSGEIPASTGRALAKLREDEQRRVWDQVADLDADQRADQLATATRGDKSFITPAIAEDELAALSPADTPTPAESAVTEPSPSRPAPAIVIRLAERSTALLAAALREELTAEELSGLVEALSQPSE